ncbi:hypothetical protein [Indibacter alkaliphilus]|uniref:hypothetical protein n=1 Tax=Indibacter alkaliphilus TaxID=579922 RepID=UPI0002823CEA|nr:hypothetical protein [Indibacter alkaliphilus]
MKKGLLGILAILILLGCSDSENPNSGQLNFVVTVSPALEGETFLFGNEDFFVLNITGNQTRFESDPVAIGSGQNFQYQLGGLGSTNSCHQFSVEAFYSGRSFHKRDYVMHGFQNSFSSWTSDCKDGYIQTINIITP